MVVTTGNDDMYVVVNTEDAKDYDWPLVWIVDEKEYDKHLREVIDIDSFDSLTTINKFVEFEYTGRNRGTLEMEYIYVE